MSHLAASYGYWVVLVTCTCSGKHTRKTQCLIFIRRCEGCDILLLLKLNFSIFQGKMFGLVGISIFWRKRCYVHPGMIAL